MLNLGHLLFGCLYFLCISWVYKSLSLSHQISVSWRTGPLKYYNSSPSWSVFCVQTRLQQRNLWLGTHSWCHYGKAPPIKNSNHPEIWAMECLIYLVCCRKYWWHGWIIFNLLLIKIFIRWGPKSNGYIENLLFVNFVAIYLVPWRAFVKMAVRHVLLGLAKRHICKGCGICLK